MTAIYFYNKEIKENPTIGSVELMEMYAKQIIIKNFANGTPSNFEELTVKDLRESNSKINELIDWCNS